MNTFDMEKAFKMLADLIFPNLIYVPKAKFDINDII